MCRQSQKLMFIGMISGYLFVSVATSQTVSKVQTIRGLFCGRPLGGNTMVDSKIRIKNNEFTYTENLKSVRYVGMKKKHAVSIGAEYIVRYKTDYEGINWAQSVTFTGRVLEIRPCMGTVQFDMQK